MYNEQTFVVKGMSFSDTVVRELADTKARLLVYRYYHMEKDMQKLPSCQKLNACYSQMSDYDRLRVDNAAADLFAQYMQDPDGFMPYKALKRKYRGLWLFWFCLFMIPVCCLGYGGYILESFLFIGYAFDPSDSEFIFSWFALLVVPAICWGLASLLTYVMTDDTMRLAKAREMLNKL